ncbi:hypothetical protein FRC03_004313, partial [Tulasnella sp. 419]
MQSLAASSGEIVSVSSTAVGKAASSGVSSGNACFETEEAREVAGVGEEDEKVGDDEADSDEELLIRALAV